MQNLEVAVIIPVKNRAELLRQTLRNVLAQSLPPAEVVVVDDSSTDHLPEVIADFGGQVRLIPNRGKGPAAARNTGYLATSAPLVQFFDSDDLITYHKLERFAKALEASGADMAYGPYVKAQEVAPGQWVQTDVIMQHGPLPSPDLEKWILRGWNALTQSMLFRRSFLELVPLWDEAHMPTEDYLYMGRLALRHPKLVHVPGEAVIYRQHGQQITGDQIKERGKALDAYQVMQKLDEAIAGRPTDFLTRAIWQGRLYLNEQYALQIGALNDLPKHKKNRAQAFVYRAYNKFERILTGTAWERMHAVSPRPEDFAAIIQNIR